MKKEVKKINPWLFWIPRILSILFILFLAMFSLDVFDGSTEIFNIIIGLFMHNIPVFILAIIIWLSWRREWVAGIAFILAGIAYMTMIFVNMFNNPFEWYMISYSFIIAGPAIIIGILFLINWKKRKEKK